MGCHIDGYVAQVAHTIIVGANADAKKVKDKKADVVVAARRCLEAGLRLLREDVLNTQVTKAIGQISEIYKTKPLEGVLSHRVKKHMIDGDDVIINKEAPDQKVEEHKFAKHEVYVLDVILSTGEGKAKETEMRTTVYKRALETSYSLKLKHSRLFFHNVSQKSPSMPFSIATLEDTTTAKVGVAECVNHDLLHMYPVLTEKPGEFVAQFKATVALLPAGTLVLNGLPFEETFYEPTHKIEDPDLVTLLATSLDRKQMKKQKKAKEAQKPAEKTEGASAAPPAKDAAPAKDVPAAKEEKVAEPAGKEDKKA